MTMKEKKKVALVAHDNMKRDLAEWVDWNLGDSAPAPPGLYRNDG